MAKAKIGFYRPHKRIYFDNTQVNSKTGEIEQIPSMTKQSFVAECDINNILKQYSTTGVIKHISERAAQGQYMDLPDEVDFQQSLEIVRQAQEAFATLPSSVRSRFENSPAEFLQFLSDPANKDEIVRLGLAKPAPVEPPPQKVEIVNPLLAPTEVVPPK